MMSVTKPAERRHDAADAVAINFFQDHAQNHGAPADENGGGIKIGHRRPAFKIHAEHEAEGVNEPGQDDEIKRRAPQQVGDIECGACGGGGATATEPRQQRQHQGEHVNDGGLVKRLHRAEEKFLAALRICGAKRSASQAWYPATARLKSSG